MNYYHMHIGDYARNTAHLSCLEDLYFRRLLDLYYTHDKPLPADINLLCRVVRANPGPQRGAVRAVLKEFFTLTEAGWRNQRCEEEIVAANIRSERAAAAGRARWRRPEVPEVPAAADATAPQGELPAFVSETTPEAPCLEHPPSIAQAEPKQSTSIAPNPKPKPIPNPNPTTATAQAAVAVDAAAAADAMETPKPDIPDPPRAVADWLNFFRREGFDGSPMASPLLRQQAQRWIDDGVTLAVMREAMMDGQSRLNGKPGSPRYYAWAVDAVMRARETARAQAELAALAPPGGPAPPASAYAGSTRYGVPESI